MGAHRPIWPLLAAALALASGAGFGPVMTTAHYRLLYTLGLWSCIGLVVATTPHSLLCALELWSHRGDDPSQLH